MPNIAIAWDFDGTLAPDDSTTKVVELLSDKSGAGFWKYIKSLRGDQKKPKWEHVLAMDAPIWMYSLSRLAFQKRIPLNHEFFREFVVPEIALFPDVISFLSKIKALDQDERFRKLDLNIHHFIVTAGLRAQPETN